MKVNTCGVLKEVADYVDYGIAVLASTLQGCQKRVHLRGLRQHQERLFKYFGIAPEELPAAEELPQPPEPERAVASEVA